MNNVVTTVAPSFLIGSSSCLQTTRTLIKSRMGSKLGRIRSGTYELAALELSMIIIKLMDNVVTTLASSFLIGSSSFLQVTRSTIKA